MDGSIIFMAFAVSDASRPYSSIVLWPICHGAIHFISKTPQLKTKRISCPVFNAQIAQVPFPDGWLRNILTGRRPPIFPGFQDLLPSWPLFPLFAPVGKFTDANFIRFKLFHASSRRRGRRFTELIPSSQLEGTQIPLRDAYHRNA